MLFKCSLAQHTSRGPDESESEQESEFSFFAFTVRFLSSPLRAGSVLDVEDDTEDPVSVFDFLRGGFLYAK